MNFNFSLNAKLILKSLFIVTTFAQILNPLVPKAQIYTLGSILIFQLPKIIEKLYYFRFFIGNLVLT